MQNRNHSFMTLYGWTASIYPKIMKNFGLEHFLDDKYDFKADFSLLLQEFSMKTK